MFTVAKKQMQKGQKTTMLKRRLKQKIVTVDFPLILQELNRNGYRFEDIAELTGTNKTTLKMVSNDNKPTPSQWNAGVKLVDMYLRVTDKTTLPFI